MWVITAQILNFTYFIKIEGKRFDYTGLIQNATKFKSEQEAKYAMQYLPNTWKLEIKELKSKIAHSII